MGKVTELRLPADREYLVVAKRSAAAIGTVAGFDLDAIDDLTIAVSQAMENAIEFLEDSDILTGEIRVAFKMAQRGLEVTIRTVVNREVEAEAQARERTAQALLARQPRRADERATADLALRLMGLFVDDHAYRVDERTGALRVRLTKYRVS